jgi:iron(III) transport system permease protein
MKTVLLPFTSLARRGRFQLSWLVIGACVLLVALLGLVPLVFLLWESVHLPQADQATLRNYIDAYTDVDALRMLWNSFTFSIGTALFAFVLGSALAWVNERTNAPLKSLTYAMAIIPLVIPGILFTIAWILLGSPKIGLINLALRELFGTDATFVDVYSMWGMIWVDGLHYSPLAFLLMSAAFRSMDPSLEESALMSGASVGRVAAAITFPLAWPAASAALLVIFVRAIESFEVPALLGLPVGINVFTSSIYAAIHQYPSKVGLASAYATLLLAIAVVGIYLQARITSRGRKFATVTGKGFRPRTVDLGRWRYVAGTFVGVYFVLLVLLPFLVLLWSSFQQFYSVPSREAIANMTLATYRNVLAKPEVVRALLNSLMLGAAAATIVMLLTAVVCWVTLKTRLPGRRLLDQLASLPMALPGLVVGLALMVLFLNHATFVYGTIWILLLAYVMRFIPYGMQYNTTSMLQVSKELEESAQMSGAGWGKIFISIMLPLLKPGMLAGWLFVMIASMRELSSSILLYSPNNEVFGTVVWDLWAAGQFVELCALGVMFVLGLFCLALVAQALAHRVGVKSL